MRNTNKIDTLNTTPFLDLREWWKQVSKKNVEHIRFNAPVNEKMEYEMKDNFNTFGLFFIFFSLLKEKKVPLIINKNSYANVMNKYIKIVLKEGKDYGIPEKKNDLMKYYIDELKKIKMIDLDENELKI